MIGNGHPLTIEASGPTEPVAGGWVLPKGDVTVGHPFGATRFYRHGWHSWSPARWVHLDRAPVTHPWFTAETDDPALLADATHAGSAVGALETGGGQVLLLGALGLDSRVRADADRLEGATDGPPCPWVLLHGTEQEVFARYAELLADHLDVRPPQPRGRVWCSWYSFFAEISEEQLADVLGDVAEMPFDVFQVDDGWQRAIGDWEANADFPGGMPALADRIERAGLEPGLWLAPFVASEHSALFGDHPELFLTDDHGEPVAAGVNWGGPYHGLDLTRPDARDVVWQTVRRARDWGFTYLKLDFLFGGALPGRRAGGLAREQAYRQGAQVVRDAAGPDAYLLACGAPVVASLGTFDALRIGPDVAPYWELETTPPALRDLSKPATRHAISTSLHRLWLRSLVALDPDVVYFRTRHNLLDEGQRALLQDLARVCGFLATSDPPAWLDHDERAALVAFLEEQPEVERTGRHRFAIDGRTVDFSAAVVDDPGSEVPTWT